MAKKDELTDQQEIFALEIAKTGQQAAAYRIAYPKSRKWKDDSVYSTASKLANTPKILQRVEELKAPAIEKAGVTIEKTITELSRLGFSDIRKFFNPDGSLKNITDLDDDSAAAISSVEVEELFDRSGKDRVWVGYTKKLKLWDKNSALEKIGKHLKMFIEKSEVDVKQQINVIINKSIDE
jgi:phage terminase small subunit